MLKEMGICSESLTLKSRRFGGDGLKIMPYGTDARAPAGAAPPRPATTKPVSRPV
jgi:hypothetical protein